MERIYQKALEISPDKKVAVHCWRGGMRSGAMAWALDFYGFDVTVIEGGYKSYRHWVLDWFEKEYPLIVLGGMTGSHKTDILKEIGKMVSRSLIWKDLPTTWVHHSEEWEN